MSSKINAGLRKDIEIASIVYVMVKPSWEEGAFWVRISKASAKEFCDEADQTGTAIQRFWTEMGNGLVLGY